MINNKEIIRKNDEAKSAKIALNEMAVVETTCTIFYEKIPEILTVEKLDSHVKDIFDQQTVKNPSSPLIKLK
jgi:hypothetical protein